MTRGQRGRRIGRWMIAAAALWIGLTWFLVIAAPGFTGGGIGYGEWPAGFFVQVLPVIAAVAQVVCLAWMIRIHRADPEPDVHPWRYRAGRY